MQKRGDARGVSRETSVYCRCTGVVTAPCGPLKVKSVLFYITWLAIYNNMLLFLQENATKNPITFDLNMDGVENGVYLVRVIN